MMKSWSFTTTNGDHEVTLEIDPFTTRTIKVDGKKVLEDTPFHNMGSIYDFYCDGQPCRIVIGRSYLVWKTKYTLLVGGEEVPERPRS